MRHPHRALVALAITALIAGACGDNGADDGASPTTTASTPTATSTPATTAAPTTTVTMPEGPPLLDLGGPVDAAATPAGLPVIAVEDGVGDVQPGWTLFNLRRFGPEGSEPLSFVAMTDDDGEVVWAVENQGFAGDAILTAAGTVMYIFDDHTIREVDLEGRIVREFASTAAPRADAVVPHPVITVDVETIHHEITELPDGNLLVLSSQTRVIDSEEALCGEDPATFDGTYEVVGDEVVEIDSVTGDVLSRRSLFSVFDPLTTQGTDFCSFSSPFGPYPDDPDANDWSHANAASLGPDGEIVVSIRHLDTIIAWPLDDPAADPLWTFGPGGTFTVPTGDDFIHQHAPELLPDGTLLVYDNGNDRPGTGDGTQVPSFSRISHYRLDDSGAELLWQYRRDARGVPVYAEAVGDVDRLANGNTLVVDGFIDLDRAEIAEIDDEDQLVRLMTVDADDAGWLVYRAERIPPQF